MLANERLLDLIFELLEAVRGGLVEHKLRNVILLPEMLSLDSPLVGLDQRFVKEKIELHDKVDDQHVLVAVERGGLEPERLEVFPGEFGNEHRGIFIVDGELGNVFDDVLMPVLEELCLFAVKGLVFA